MLRISANLWAVIRVVDLDGRGGLDLNASVIRTAAKGRRFQRPGGAPGHELWRQVEVIRTAHGVPHIRAQKSACLRGYALAWLQCEDYGTTTPMEILAASGRRASVWKVTARSNRTSRFS